MHTINIDFNNKKNELINELATLLSNKNFFDISMVFEYKNLPIELKFKDIETNNSDFMYIYDHLNEINLQSMLHYTNISILISDLESFK